ncbi:MAG: RHS repeat-associated core domain-containing protein, partial [Culicoidibacterales bacterium]
SNERFNGQKTYYQYDAKGSVVGQESSKKPDALLFKIRYNDFGQPHRKLDNEFGYNAEAHDYNGTQYLRARYYDTKNGRFDQRDSYRGDTKNPISQNRYTYVWNNPSKYIDSSGNRPYIDAGQDEQATHDNEMANKYDQGGKTWKEVEDEYFAGRESARDRYDAVNKENAEAAEKYHEEQQQKAEAAQKVREQEKLNIENELVQKGIQVPSLEGLSFEEQLRILREIKKLCDEIEGKYGKWDDAARDEAQKKVDLIILKLTAKEKDLPVSYDDYNGILPEQRKSEVNIRALLTTLLLVLLGSVTYFFAPLVASYLATVQLSTVWTIILSSGGTGFAMAGGPSSVGAMVSVRLDLIVQAIAGVLISGLVIYIADKLSKKNSDKYTAEKNIQSWNEGTFDSPHSSAEYHYNKHVINKGLNKTFKEYTQDAMNFYNKYKDSSSAEQHVMNNGKQGIRIKNIAGEGGGYFTNDGKIITFWYK